MRVLSKVFRLDRARTSEGFGSRHRAEQFFWLVLAIVALFARGASAQIFQEDDTEARRQRREAHSPRLENALLQARSVLESNPELAVDILQSIFDAPEDSYYATKTGCSLKDAAEVLLLSGPESLLKGYQRRFDAAATGVFDQARREGKLAGLREVARRYPLTAAGRTAMMELVVASCDSGDASSALRLIQRLRRIPAEVQQFEPRLSLIEVWAQRELRNDEAAASRLNDLKARSPEALVLDGRRIAWFSSDVDRDQWLAGVLPARAPMEPQNGLPAWKMAHGDRRRNSPASDAPPFLDSAWKTPLADRYDDIRKYDDPWNDSDIKLVNQSAADLETRFRKDGLHPLPVAAPLITSDLAIFAGFGAVKAYRLKTGELAWSSEPVDETLLALLAGTDSSVQRPKPFLMQQYVGQRAYRDHVDASLSTDGKRVYHVGHSGLIGLQPNSGALPVSTRGASPLLPRNYNHLQAYDINGGRCLWSIGGPPRRLEAAYASPDQEFSFDGAFFSMAPIPWEDQLLCIIEQSRQLRIVSVDPEKRPFDEPPFWSQALLNSDLDLVYSPDRRFAGVNVAIDGSTLVATLGNGTVIGFDVADRRWLWLYTYADPPPVDYRRMLQINRMQRPVTDEAELEATVDMKEWSETRTLMHGHYVLVTPFDDSRLLCLDRQTGKLLWSRARDQAMYLAGVHDDIIILVGKSDVRGLRLQDGQALWSSPIPPASGRGVRMGSRYVLPLSTGEVLTLDIRTGSPIARSPLASGEVAGTLIAAGGMLVTQTGSEFRAFRTAGDVKQEIEQRLAASSNDPVALALRGELKLHQGDVAGGEEDLRKVENPPTRIKQVLAWAQVNGLERDFASYYTPDLNLDSLPSDAGLRAQGWAAVSRGLQERGDLPGALLAAIRSGESLNPAADRLLDREESLRVRENRLVRGRVEDLWQVMSREQREESIRRIRDRLQQLNPSVPEHFRIHEMLTGQILPADLELAHLRRRTLPLVLMEQRLLRLRESNDDVIAAGANFELLKIGAQDPRMTPSPAVIAELTGRLKDVPIEGSKTAGELTAAILNQADVAKRREMTKGLSGELVAATLEDAPGIPEFPTPFTESGRRSLLMEGWSFAADQMQSQFYATDARGVLKLNERINRGMLGLSTRMSTSGRLVLVELVDGFRIYDAVAGTSVLSTMVTTEPFESIINGGFNRAPRVNPNRQPRTVAPLRSEHLAYLKGKQLLVVDPLTSGPREHWSRTVEGIVDVTSDADFVAVEDAKFRVKVFRASDGRLLRETQLPEGSLRDHDYRRDIQRLLRLPAKESIEIGLFHPAYETWTWRRTFPAETQFDVVDGGGVAALEPSGRFTLLDDKNGEVQLTAQLKIPPDLERVEASRDASRVYVKAIRISNDFMSIPRRATRVNARVFALSQHTGDLLWSRDFANMTLEPQPGSWPFFFVTADGEADEAGKAPSLAYIIDRATGKTLHAVEYALTAGQRGWKVDAATGTVTLKAGGAGIQVSQRAETGPPPPPLAIPGS